MELKEFFKDHPDVALAFSGGVDSAYLLYAAKQYGANCTAYFVKTPFQPEFELEDAMNLAKELDMPVKVIHVDILADETIRSNPENRCYYCKKRIFSQILKTAEEDHYTLIIDGTNASDDAGDRPGMKALKEMSVRSPLRECGLTKAQIRQLSREAGLFTWDKPAYACLATRVQTNEQITAEKLEKVERAEAYLHHLGFQDIRVRVMQDTAKIQIHKAQFPLYDEHASEIETEFKQYFDSVIFDPRGRDK